MTRTTLFDQNKLFPHKLDAILNPELVLKFPKVLFIIGYLRFHLKLLCFFLNENFLKFSRFGYFSGLLVKIFYFTLVDYMYDLMCKVFSGPKFAYFLGSCGEQTDKHSVYYI